MADEHAAPPGDSTASPPGEDAASPPEEDTGPPSQEDTGPPSQEDADDAIRRRLSRIGIGGLALALITVLAGLAQISGFSLRDLGEGDPATMTGSKPPTSAAPPHGPAGSSPPSGPLSSGPPPGGQPSTDPASTAPSSIGRSSTTPGGGTDLVGAHQGGDRGTGQPTAGPSQTTAPAPTAFRVETPAELPMCSDIGGTGTQPATGRVLVFVRHAGQTRYFYEQPVEYPAAGQWVSHDVRLGDPPDSGQFYVLAVRVDQPLADTIVQECRSRPCPYDDHPPGAILATSNPVTRTASTGGCAA